MINNLNIFRVNHKVTKVVSLTVFTMNEHSADHFSVLISISEHLFLTLSAKKTCLKLTIKIKRDNRTTSVTLQLTHNNLIYILFLFDLAAQSNFYTEELQFTQSLKGLKKSLPHSGFKI